MATLGDATTTLKIERRGESLLVALHRPHRLNAISRAMVDELNTVFDQLARWETKVMVLTGLPRASGDPCFCAGADFKEPGPLGGYRPGPVGGIEAFAHTAPPPDSFSSLLDRLESLPVITIAAIDGICAGGGLGLALCCDIRLLADTAVVRDVHVPVQGRIGHAVTSRLSRLVGSAWAKEILLLGEVLPPQVAVRIGLARDVVSSGRLIDEAFALAERFEAAELDAIRTVKAVVDYAADTDRSHAQRFAYLAWAISGGGIDIKAPAEYH